MSWIPKLVEDAGFTAADGRFAFLLFNLGGVVGIFSLGTFATRWRLSNLVAVFILASAASMLIFAQAPDSLIVLMTVIGAVGFLIQGGFTGFYSIAAKIYPTHIRATGVGWAIGLGRLGAVVGPAVAGYLIAGGLGLAGNFAVFAVPLVLSGVIAWLMKIR